MTSDQAMFRSQSDWGNIDGGVVEMPSVGPRHRGVRRLVIDQFVKHQQYRGLSASTIKRRRNVLNQLAEWIEPLGLERATRDHLEAFIGSKQEPRTKHAYRSDLRVFYEWAVSHELMAVNPALTLDTIRVPKTLPRPLDPATARALLWYGSMHVRRMIGLALFAGLRCFEIANLDGGDVWRHHEPPVIVVRNGKGAKDRVVPLHDDLTELLAGAPVSGPVFPAPCGGRSLRSASVARAITRHMLSCGVEATPHQLRHTFGTGLARASNGDMVLTAELMGHESMNTTMGYVRLAHTGGVDVVRRLYEDVA